MPLTIDDLRTILPDVVDALPPVERGIVTALFWERLSTREVAREIGCNQSTVVRIRDRAFRRIAALVDGDEG